MLVAFVLRAAFEAEARAEEVERAGDKGDVERDEWRGRERRLWHIHILPVVLSYIFHGPAIKTGEFLQGIQFNNHK